MGPPISATVTGAQSVAQEWMAVPPAVAGARRQNCRFSRMVEFLILLPNKPGRLSVRLRRRDPITFYRIMFCGPWVPIELSVRFTRASVGKYLFWSGISENQGILIPKSCHNARFIAFIAWNWNTRPALAAQAGPFRGLPKPHS